MTIGRTPRVRMYAPYPPTPQIGLTDFESAFALRESSVKLLSALLNDPPAVLLTTSCTHALELSAILTGVSARDEVVVPAFTFPSTANAFLLRGASVRIADIEPETLNIDPRSVAERIGDRTRAIAIVHYAGIAADLGAMRSLAETVGASVIEDAAHALFSAQDGTPLGRFGQLGTLSFHRTKNISTGEGGALIVNDSSLVDDARQLLDHGTNRSQFEAGALSRYEWLGMGTGGRMSDLLLPTLATQLANGAAIQAARHHVWSRYHGELAAWASGTGARLPTVPHNSTHSAHIFFVILPNPEARSRFIQFCAQAGIETASHYDSLSSAAFRAQLGQPADPCPAAEDIASRLVRLPLHHELGRDAVDHVIGTVTSFR